MSETDKRFMALALSLGRRGLGHVWPNPAVGCVIVKDGRIVGRGWTRPGGRPHAETEALAMAGKAAREAVAYVTMEPCAHHGHTPPCAEALVEAGVSRVVVGAADPDPRVDGRGVAILREAKVEVTTGILKAEAEAANAGFLMRLGAGRPFVTLKLAASLDGRIATASGESQWITGPEARRHVHSLRASHDAVMVGAGTARADNPMLTVCGLGEIRQPVRIVLSRRLDLPLDSQLARTAATTPVWLCHGADAEPELVDAWRTLGAELIVCQIGRNRQLDPTSVLKALGARGLTRVFCEGGGALAASLLGAGLVDELICYTAGIGLGAEGQPMLGAMGQDRLAAIPRFDLVETRVIGGDVLHRWQRAHRD